MHPLVTALIERQDAEGLGNNAFARKLGVDKGTWSNVRRGIEEPTGVVFAAAFRTYPDAVQQAAQVMEISSDNGDDLRQPVEAAS
jgi:hypothetical protein